MSTHHVQLARPSVDVIATQVKPLRSFSHRYNSRYKFLVIFQFQFQFGLFHNMYATMYNEFANKYVKLSFIYSIFRREVPATLTANAIYRYYRKTNPSYHRFKQAVALSVIGHTN